MVATRDNHGSTQIAHHAICVCGKAARDPSVIATRQNDSEAQAQVQQLRVLSEIRQDMVAQVCTRRAGIVLSKWVRMTRTYEEESGVSSVDSGHASIESPVEFLSVIVPKTRGVWGVRGEATRRDEDVTDYYAFYVFQVAPVKERSRSFQLYMHERIEDALHRPLTTSYPTLRPVVRLATDPFPDRLQNDYSCWHIHLSAKILHSLLLVGILDYGKSVRGYAIGHYLHNSDALVPLLERVEAELPLA